MYYKYFLLFLHGQFTSAWMSLIIVVWDCCGKKNLISVYWSHKGSNQTIKQQHCFVLQLFYLLIYFKTRNFTHIILLSFYFSVTVITQIFFHLKSLN